MTKISLPVILSEPLSSLQKTCENHGAYEELIREAAQIDDPMERFLKFAAHTLS